MSKLLDLFNTRKRYADVQARQAAKGQLHICPACGTKTYHREYTQCAVCLTQWDGTPSAQTQVVRTYTGASLDKAFQADAALMSHAGWRIASQNYGGVGSAGMPALVFGAVGGLLAKRTPTHLTVIYDRPQ